MVGRLIAAGVVVALVVAGVTAFLVLRGGDGARAGAMGESAFCEELRAVDVGESLGGDDPAARVAAVVTLADLASRAPAEVRDPMLVIEAQAGRHDAISDVAPDDLADPDVQMAALQAVYTLRFQPDLRAAAATVERYAFEQCGIPLSGHFDLEVDAEIDGTLFPGLDLSDFEDPTFEFDEAQFEQYGLQGVQEPHFEFDRSDWDRYQLQTEETR